MKIIKKNNLILWIFLVLLFSHLYPMNKTLETHGNLKNVVNLLQQLKAKLVSLLQEIQALAPQTHDETINAVIALDDFQDSHVSALGAAGPIVQSVIQGIKDNMIVITPIQIIAALKNLVDQKITVNENEKTKIINDLIPILLPPIIEQISKKESNALQKTLRKNEPKEVIKIKEKAEEIIKKLESADYKIFHSSKKTWNNNDFVVLIPKKYSDRTISEFLNKEQFNRVNKIPDLSTQLKSLISENKKGVNIIDKLISILNPSKKISKRYHLVGHGMRSPTTTSEHTDGSLENDQKAFIGGLLYEEYKKLLLFFEESNCDFLSISSCFSGGLNRLLMHKFISYEYEENQPTVSFPIVLNSMSDAVASFDKKNVNYTQFFDEVNNFIETRSKKSVEKNYKPQQFPAIALANAMQHIAGKDLLNEPSVLIPGTRKFFRPIKVSNEIEFLNYPALLDHELNFPKQPYLIKNTIKVVSVYPSVIQIPLKIENTQEIPLLVSMIPGRSRHFIKSIELPSDTNIKEGLRSLILGIKESSSSFKNIFLKDPKKIFKEMKTKALSLAMYIEARKVFVFKEVIIGKNKYNNVIVNRYYQQYNQRNILMGDLYYRENNSYKKIDLAHEKKEVSLTIKAARNLIQPILENACPEKNALFEGVGGHETDTTFKKAIKKRFGFSLKK